MTKAAAFFDLDKTLLAKSSTLVYAKPLYQSGMLTRQDLMRSAYGQFVYLVAGANEQQMDQMRVYMSELVKGWDVEQVKAIAAEGLANVIEPIVYAEALTLFDEHHAAGRDVIVISSSGTEIIEPILRCSAPTKPSAVKLRSKTASTPAKFCSTRMARVRLMQFACWPPMRDTTFRRATRTRIHD